MPINSVPVWSVLNASISLYCQVVLVLAYCLSAQLVLRCASPGNRVHEQRVVLECKQWSRDSRSCQARNVELCIVKIWSKECHLKRCQPIVHSSICTGIIVLSYWESCHYTWVSSTVVFQAFRGQSATSRQESGRTTWCEWNQTARSRCGSYMG